MAFVAMVVWFFVPRAVVITQVRGRILSFAQGLTAHAAWPVCRCDELRQRNLGRLVQHRGKPSLLRVTRVPFITPLNAIGATVCKQPELRLADASLRHVIRVVETSWRRNGHCHRHCEHEYC